MTSWLRHLMTLRLRRFNDELRTQKPVFVIASLKWRSHKVISS